MRLAFCTNIWNHHQAPVCYELAKLLGADFKMFVYQPLDCRFSRERIAMGWNLIPPDEPWIVGPPKTKADLCSDFYQGWIGTADVLVFGSNCYFDNDMLKRRLKAGKLSFRMGERLLKLPVRWYHWISPRFYKRWLWLHQEFNFKALHYLTMSHWCADDLAFFHACKGRIWRWGYLTPVSEKPTEKPAREKIRIGWCGRFLCLKNVCDILQATSSLELRLREGVEVILVGDGSEKENLIHLAHSLGLENIVQFKPFMPSAAAKAFMRELDIYVFPSGRQEGWGAVLAEAMDASCAVIANEAAGSTLELVKNGANGFTYRDGDLGALTRRLTELVENATLRKKFGLAAWQTMQEWSPAVGARRLVALAEHILQKGTNQPFQDGLCSVARKDKR